MGEQISSRSTGMHLGVEQLNSISCMSMFFGHQPNIQEQSIWLRAGAAGGGGSADGRSGHADPGENVGNRYAGTQSGRSRVKTHCTSTARESISPRKCGLMIILNGDYMLRIPPI